MLSKLIAFTLVALLHIAALLGLGLLSGAHKMPELPTTLPTLQAVWIDPNPPVAARAAERPPEPPSKTESTPPEPPKKPPVKKVPKPKIVASSPEEPQEKPEPKRPDPAPEQPAATPATSTTNRSEQASGGVVGGTGKAEQGAAAGTDEGGGAPMVESSACKAASYRQRIEPNYPPLSKRRNETGTVVIRLRINADGSASNIRVQKSSGFPALDQAALEAISQSRFIPCERDGAFVAKDYNAPVHFRLTHH